MDVVLGGRYRVQRVLGRGGMGAVVAAVDEQSGATVALKLLDDARLGDDASRARFAREAELQARLTSASVPRVLDRAPTFFVMEYLNGTTLEHVVDEQGKLAPRAAIGHALAVLDVLRELHALGFVHGDVKPGNVLVLEGGGTKLLDFGLATPIGERALDAGTLAFASPEQARGEPVDARSDLYALSATLHRALTGSLVFPVEPIGTFFEQLGSAVRPAAGVDPTLDVAIVRGLAPDPADRWPSATLYFTALSAWLSGANLAP